MRERPVVLLCVGSSYALAILVPTFIYFLLYFVALGWILFADWYRFVLGEGGRRRGEGRGGWVHGEEREGGSPYGWLVREGGNTSLHTMQ